MERIREIDGLRALAALAVFAFHVFGTPAIARYTRIGWIGVDLFFVISGYLITTILLGMRGDPHYFKNFYMRRTLRIFPPFYLFFLICLVTALAIHNYQWSARLWLAFGLYASSLVAMKNWYHGDISHVPGPARGIELTWSLSIEELFYLVWAPAVRYLRKGVLLAIVVATIVLTPLLRWFLHLKAGGAEYYFFPARVDTLAFGALLALLRHAKGGLRVAGWMVALGFVASGALLLGMADPVANGIFALAGYTCVALTMSLLVAFVLEHAGTSDFLCRALRTRLLVGVGTISYTFYLSHLYIIRAFTEWLPELQASHSALSRIVRLVGSFAVTLAFSALSWRYFESPILRLKSRFASRPEDVVPETESTRHPALQPNS